MDAAQAHTQSSDYSAPAWYKSGGTVFSTIQGRLSVVNGIVNFTDNDGKTHFTFPLKDVGRVRFDPSEFLFETSSGNYLVSLFNLKKYSAELGAGGMIGTGKAMADVQAANAGAISLETILKDHGIPTYGIRTNIDYARQQRNGILLLFLYMAITAAVIFGIVTLTGHY